MKREVFYKKMKPILALNAKLNKYRYGIIDTEKNSFIEDPGDEDFDLIYRACSTADFEYYKGGVCWDYCRYYDEKLRAMGYTTINLFIVSKYITPNSRTNTHTVVIIELDDIYVWVESSWKSMCGVYVAKDFESLVMAIVTEFTADNYAAVYEVHDYYEAPPIGYTCAQCLRYYMKAKRIMKGKMAPHRPGGLFETLSGGTGMIKRLVGMYSESGVVLEEVEDGVVEEPYNYFVEAKIAHTLKMKTLLEEKIFKVLDDPVGRKKYARIQSAYIDRNAEKLSTAGPMYLIVFGEADHKEYLDLFGITKEEIVATMKEIVKESGATSDFKFLTQHPMLNVLYFCIRYFTLKEDAKGLNSTLGIYALDVYWTTFKKYFPKGVIEPVMAYTIDNLTEKFVIKKVHTIFNLLMSSITQSYNFHKKNFYVGADDCMTAFAQRIKNDQNSMIRKIANKYMENWKNGKAITIRNAAYDENNPIVDDIENATTQVSTMVAAIVPQMISNGVDLRLAMAAAKMSEISITDCREYLTELISEKRVDEVESVVQSIIYIFLITDGRSQREIKSQYFLAWGKDLVKKTNSNDDNINNITSVLKKWSDESGITQRYNSKGVRSGYKKAILLYIIMTIQKYA